MKNEAFVSVIIIVAYSDTKLEADITDIMRRLDAHYSDYEIVLVVQGPVGKHISENQEKALLTHIPCIRLIQLAYEVHEQVAMSAGIENAIGDFTVLYDPATDPPDLIINAVEVCRRGSDIVVGSPEKKLSIGDRIVLRLSRIALEAIDYNTPANLTNFYCVSRRAINAVINTDYFYYQLTLRLQKTGYPMAILPYAPKPRPSAHPSFLLSVRRLLRLLIFNSTRPLRWMSAIGLLGSFFALFFAVYSLVVHMIRTGVVEGWTTTILFMSTQFLLMFIILAFISEYMGRILDEQRGGTKYAIVYERNSAVMVNSDRVNVLNDAVSAEFNLVQTASNG